MESLGSCVHTQLSFVLPAETAQSAHSAEKQRKFRRAREREREREKGDLRCRWWSPADPSLLLPSLIAAAFFAFFWDSVLRAAILRARSSHGVRQNKITGNKDSQI
jgi:hypothetical protein